MNNKGFTLIEVLVALGISSIIMSAIVTFIVVGSRSYKMTEQEVNMQTESQTAINLVGNVLLEANDVKYGYFAATTPPVKETGKPVWADYIRVDQKKYDGASLSYIVHYFVQSDNNIYYKKYTFDTEDDYNNVDNDTQCTDVLSETKKNLMAAKIEDNGMKLNINKKSGNIVNVFVELVFMTDDGRTLSVKNTIRPRNNVVYAGGGGMPGGGGSSDPMFSDNMVRMYDIEGTGPYYMDPHNVEHKINTGTTYGFSWNGKFYSCIMDGDDIASITELATINDPGDPELMQYLNEVEYDYVFRYNGQIYIMPTFVSIWEDPYDEIFTDSLLASLGL
ncbi:MAG: prepilin-type N-terminal cleavage/methylation domain-containing protein [Lachnospiraceae bacterium]|nr:prepilin-type N-terminal cleavage/methylation domain-containing protein [Lachnospiraceae bacterium]